MATIVKANSFNGGKDVNGMAPVYLTPVKGVVPQNAKVLSGTVAESLGIEVGKIYLVEILYDRHDENYGDQWKITNLGSLSSPDIKVMLEFNLVEFDVPQKLNSKTGEVGSSDGIGDVKNNTPIQDPLQQTSKQA